MLSKSILVLESDRMNRFFQEIYTQRPRPRFSSGLKEFRKAAEDCSWDLIILDKGLKFLDIPYIAINLSRTIDAPIMLLEEQGGENDSWCKLVNYSDKYFRVPYCETALGAQIEYILNKKSTLRRGKNDPILDFNNLSISARGRQLMLTAVESKLLALMYRNPGRVYSRQCIIDCIYSDYRIISDRTIDSHIRNLRRKINEFGLGRNPIKTVYGLGYMYDG